MSCACLLGSLALIFGCDSGTPVGYVSGIVTYGEAPLVSAEVEFTPVGQGTSSVGFTNQKGEYELQYTLQKKGALLGMHKVSVRSLELNDHAQARIRAASRQARLECEVTSGSNEFNIELPIVELERKQPKRG